MDINPALLRLTEAAAARINKVVQAEGKPELKVRLEVLGGGCSGYQYKFAFDSVYDAAEDILVTRDGAQLVIDKTSLSLLEGSEVDFSESLMEAGFRVINPKAVSSCGCGTSFDIKN